MVMDKPPIQTINKITKPLEELTEEEILLMVKTSVGFDKLKPHIFDYNYPQFIELFNWKYSQFLQSLVQVYNSVIEHSMDNNIVAKTREVIEKGSSTQILYADNNDSAILIYKLLRNKGYTNVTMIRNTKDTIEKAREVNFDLILMDTISADFDCNSQLNGYIATKEIKKLPNHKNTPIIALAKYKGSKNGNKECFEAGCVDVIIKPVNVEELFNKVIRYTRLKENS